MDKRLLVITKDPWDNSISTGNTLSNMFYEWSSEFIANLYCKEGQPKNEICHNYFRITEHDLIKNILNSKKVGTRFDINASLGLKNEKVNNSQKKMYNFFNKYRLIIFLWIRELIWKLGKWNNDELKNFITSFNPEIIYMPVYTNFYMHNILKTVKKMTNAKIILFTGDDVYSLKQFSISPLFWINKFILRKYIARSFRYANICFSLSEQQISELKPKFGDKFKLYRKSIFDLAKLLKSKLNREMIDFVYTGNLSLGRFKTLNKLASAIHKVNKKGILARLYIYSNNSLKPRQISKISIEDEVFFLGKIEPMDVEKVQKQADILVHVESFKLKYKLQTRLSFSTKLVDYIKNGKCILAIGWKNANSIKYLKENDAAIIVNNISYLDNIINEIISNSNIISEFSEKSWLLGKKNHDYQKAKKYFDHEIASLWERENENRSN